MQRDVPPGHPGKGSRLIPHYGVDAIVGAGVSAGGAVAVTGAVGVENVVVAADAVGVRGAVDVADAVSVAVSRGGVGAYWSAEA